MKKALTITMVFMTLIIYAQDYSHVSNPVVGVEIFKGSDALGPDNTITVPDGYFVTFAKEGYEWWWSYPDDSTYIIPIDTNTALPSSYRFFTYEPTDFLIVYFHEYAASGSTFSYNEAELNNSVKLFPNPTTSEVALNSEKTYEIQVFDILGNKVMELVGNSISMEHLSNATYIVNALDVESRESLSYKVIKK